MYFRPGLPTSSAYDRVVNPHLLDQLMAPAVGVLNDYIRGVYRDGPLDDFRFLRCGIHRTLSQSASGRDFLQSNREIFDEPLARSTFFDSLHSTRRRDILAELNTQLVLRASSGPEEKLLADGVGEVIDEASRSRGAPTMRR